MNAVGYLTKEAVGRYNGILLTVSVKADIDILFNIRKTTATHFDFRVVTEGIEIEAGVPAKVKPRTRSM